MKFGFREIEKIRVPVFISCDSPWGQMSQVARSHSVSFLRSFLHCQVLPHFSSHGPRPLYSALPSPLFSDLPVASVSCPLASPLPVPSSVPGFPCLFPPVTPDTLGFACMAGTCVCLDPYRPGSPGASASLPQGNALHIPTSPCVMKKRHFLFICQVF